MAQKCSRKALVLNINCVSDPNCSYNPAFICNLQKPFSLSCSMVWVVPIGSWFLNNEIFWVMTGERHDPNADKKQPPTALKQELGLSFLKLII